MINVAADRVVGHAELVADISGIAALRAKGEHLALAGRQRKLLAHIVASGLPRRGGSGNGRRLAVFRIGTLHRVVGEDHHDEHEHEDHGNRKHLREMPRRERRADQHDPKRERPAEKHARRIAQPAKREILRVRDFVLVDHRQELAHAKHIEAGKAKHEKRTARKKQIDVQLARHCKRSQAQRCNAEENILYQIQRHAFLKPQSIKQNENARQHSPEPYEPRGHALLTAVQAYEQSKRERNAVTEHLHKGEQESPFWNLPRRRWSKNSTRNIPFLDLCEPLGLPLLIANSEALLPASDNREPVCENRKHENANDCRQGPAWLHACKCGNGTAQKRRKREEQKSALGLDSKNAVDHVNQDESRTAAEQKPQRIVDRARKQPPPRRKSNQQSTYSGQRRQDERKNHENRPVELLTLAGTHYEKPDDKHNRRPEQSAPLQPER